MFETWGTLLCCELAVFLNFYFIQKEVLNTSAQLTLMAVLHVKLNRSQELT